MLWNLRCSTNTFIYFSRFQDNVKEHCPTFLSNTRTLYVVSACTKFFSPFTKSMEQWNWSIISDSSLIPASTADRRRKTQIDSTRKGKPGVECTRGNPMHRFRNDMKKSDWQITDRRDRTWRVSRDFRTITRKSTRSRDKARGGERDYVAGSTLSVVFI